MDGIIWILIAVFGVFQICLLFKIWGMTNDIRDIKNVYLSQHKRNEVPTDNDTSDTSDTSDYNNLTVVVELKTENQMRLGELLENGKYKCYSNGVYAGDFAPSEFMEFDKWVKEIYNRK